MQTTRGASLSDEHGRRSPATHAGTEPPEPIDPQEAPPAGPVARRRRLGGRHPAIFVGVTAFVIAVDQLSKAAAMHWLSDGASRPLIGHVLQATLTRNSGAAFSTMTGATWVITVAVSIVCLVIVAVSARIGSRWWSLAFGLLLGGALGNLVDRLFRDPGFGTGHVVDFLQLPHWPIFNLADSSVVAAAILIVLLTLMGRTLDGRRMR